MLFQLVAAIGRHVYRAYVSLTGATLLRRKWLERH
jgi:hypothetical protein